MFETEYLKETEYNSIKNGCEELRKMLSSTTKTFYNPENMKKSQKRYACTCRRKNKRSVKKVSHNETMIFLNYMKYSMEMEHHAYNQDLLYVKILQKIGKPVDKENLEDYNERMAFPEKIKIINGFIREEFEKSRSKI